MKVKIKILTPVHIWDWNTISGIDYFCLQEKLNNLLKTDDWKEINYESFLYKFSMHNFIEKVLDEKDKQKIKDILNKWTDVFELRNFIFNTLQNNKDYQERFKKIAKNKIKITNSFYKLWKEKIVWKVRKWKWKTLQKRENEFTNQLSQLNIKEFINSLWRQYIPWSSLKWAIRTILINSGYNQDAVNDDFKKLIVRDSNFVKDWIEIWKLARQSQKWDWVFAEFLEPWLDFETEIIVKNFIDEKKLKWIDFSKENIIKRANNYLKNKIEKYIKNIKILLKHEDINKVWHNYKLDKFSENKQIKLNSVIESFQKILDELDNLEENEYILNIWFGWWFWFKMFEETDEKHPKFCSNHQNWEPDGMCHIKNKDCDIISWMQVKHLKCNEVQIKCNEVQIPRTNWQIDLENLWFIKLTFTD